MSDHIPKSLFSYLRFVDYTTLYFRVEISTPKYGKYEINKELENIEERVSILDACRILDVNKYFRRNP